MRGKRLILAGDVGGTHTRLGLFDAGNPASLNLVQLTEYRSDKLDSLESGLGRTLAGNSAPILAATVAVAGPILEGYSKLTNLTWEVSEPALKTALNTERVELINDQVGLAYFVASTGPDMHERLNDAPRILRGPVAILAPGTGLGEGYMTWDGTRYKPFPSEGGHADFAPVNARQQRLLAFMLSRHKRVSVERVCSGKGMANLYQFLRDVEGLKEPAWLRDRVSQAEDPVPVIVEAAQRANVPDDLCATTVALFVEVLAQEAGNLALKLLPNGGLYLGGGIPPRILRELRAGFLKPFRAKGRMEDLLRRIPLFVVTHEQPTLFGAAQRALDLLAEA